MNVVGSSYVRRWPLLVTDTTKHLTNWMVKPYFEAICNNSRTTTMHSKILKKSSTCSYVSGKIITAINFHTLWDIWHLCTSKRTKIPCLNEQFHMFYFLFECVVYMYFWQNISILLAYDVLVTAACQELTPFWGTVYDDNDKDDEDNNDRRRQQWQWWRQQQQYQQQGLQIIY